MFTDPPFDVFKTIFLGMTHLGHFFSPLSITTVSNTTPEELVNKIPVNRVFPYTVVLVSVVDSPLKDIVDDDIMSIKTSVSSILKIVSEVKSEVNVSTVAK